MTETVLMLCRTRHSINNVEPWTMPDAFWLFA